MTLTFKDVSEILKIIDESDVEELVVEMGDTKIIVRRHASDGERRSSTPANTPAPSLEPAAPTPKPESPSKSRPPQPAPDRTGMTTVTAPMVGTFYRRPGPQDPPFVEVGDTVTAGDPIALIEVMKLFTTIEAPVAGRIVEIPAENEALVQIDELLFVIDPD